MCEFDFEWQGKGDLLDEIKRPATAISANQGANGIYSLRFHRSDGTALLIYCAKKDLGGQEEVGVLGFSLLKVDELTVAELEVPASFYDVTDVKKLVVDEGDSIVAESGIEIMFKNGASAIVVAGVFPLTLAVTGLAGLHAKFDPEWPLERYRRANF